MKSMVMSGAGFLCWQRKMHDPPVVGIAHPYPAIRICCHAARQIEPIWSGRVIAPVLHELALIGEFECGNLLSAVKMPRWSTADRFVINEFLPGRDVPAV
jgi:hypothetical protein